jgi:hypothetical protein
VSTNNKRKVYESHLHTVKSSADTKIKELQQLKKESDENPENSELLLNMAYANLTLTSLYLTLSNLAHTYLGTKNESSLNEARKALTNAIMNLEKVYTPYIDVPYSDYENHLQKVLHINEFERYTFILQTGFYCDYLAACYGEQNRYRWMFTELKGRIAAVFKNSFDLKTLLPQLDPRAPDFARRIGFVNFNRALIMSTAANYRKKYELFSHEPMDFRKAIDYLLVMKRFSILLNRNNDVAELQKQIDIWSAKLENDLKKAGH